MKQKIVAALFLISAAGMDSDCNVLMGAIAIASVICLKILCREEQKNVSGI